MDDKVFLFIILIPGIVIGISYYLMKNAQKGKLHFIILTSILVLANILFDLFVIPESKGEFDFGSAAQWGMFLYVELAFLLFFSIIYRSFVTNQKDEW